MWGVHSPLCSVRDGVFTFQRLSLFPYLYLIYTYYLRKQEDVGRLFVSKTIDDQYVSLNNFNNCTFRKETRIVW